MADILVKTSIFKIDGMDKIVTSPVNFPMKSINMLS